MILNLTDSEALAISQKLQEEKAVGESIPGLGGEAAFGELEIIIDPLALASAIGKLDAAMKKSDDKLSRTLSSAISSLTASGFDSVQIAALQSAKDKAAEHNLKKYPSKDKGKL